MVSSFGKSFIFIIILYSFYLFIGTERGVGFFHFGGFCLNFTMCFFKLDCTITVKEINLDMFV